MVGADATCHVSVLFLPVLPSRDPVALSLFPSLLSTRTLRPLCHATAIVTSPSMLLGHCHTLVWMHCSLQRKRKRRSMMVVLVGDHQ